jgi:RNA polymerase sigma factor (sigma-70 family)
MQPRQEIVELFSTFAQFEEDYFSRWLSDVKLRRSMVTCLNASPEMTYSEQVWALYWHQIWQNQTNILAGSHLSAYLQEPCYWAAQHTVRRFTNTQYQLADYFQLAIADLDKVLKSFNPDRGSSLRAYAKIAFSSLLKDILRQRQAADLCTNWALLRKTTRKRVVEALEDAGFSTTEIAQYRLAWTCFNALYIPTQLGTARLPEPDRPLWVAIANLYNTEQRNLAASSSSCTAEMIEQWLSRLAGLIRAYLYPALTTSTSQIFEDPEREFDSIDHASESSIAKLIAQEEIEARFNQQMQVGDVLVRTLEQMNSEYQDVLRLYYQQQLTQLKISQQLNKPQAWVSRRLSKARELLLTALVEWSRKELNISVTPNLINNMETALAEWLSDRYAEPNRSVHENA